MITVEMLIAVTFSENILPQKFLETCGFEKTEIMHRDYLLDGKHYKDNYRYELIKDGNMKIRKIYFDMDGVLADFRKGLKDMCGVDMPDQSKSTDAEDDAMWEAVRDTDHFYNRLEPIPGALEMYKELSGKYDCAILSAIPKPERGIITAGEDKIKWARRLLSDTMEINIVLKKEKEKYALDSGYILIDDLEGNIEKWENAGGTGIQFISVEDVMGRIKEIEAN